MFIQRAASALLEEWIASPIRKPLVIRGARQVGKTALVRHFAQSQNLQLIEINLERKPALASAFNTNEPKDILFNLESALNLVIDPNQAILFLDEIQAAPELLAKLRWFAEDMPELPVIATGSLLEFVLEDHTFSMPVGRINYLHLEPLTFEEFLQAKSEDMSLRWLHEYSWDKTIPDILHVKFLNLVKEYSLIGGMPAAVASWVTTNSLHAIHQIHHELLATYSDDFPKYTGKIPASRLQKTLGTVPQMLGQKCIYSRFGVDGSSIQIKQAIDLLAKARLVHRVYNSHANGVPLAAEINDKFFKLIFIDIGLASSTLGLNFTSFQSLNDFEIINQGGLSEQLVGQALRTIEPYYVEPALYYWARDLKGSNAEVDYLIQHGQHVIPIEVKAGKTGSLKSLHLFMSFKKLGLAIRFCSDLPTKTPIEVKLFDGSSVSYHLLSLPFYLIGQIHRLTDHFMKD